MAIDLITRESDKKTPTRAFSKKQEDKVAKVTGGRVNPNSGATDFGGKSDVNIDNLISIECKTKTSASKSISIKKEWITKLRQETVFDGNKYCAIAFSFGPGEENHYIIDEDLFIRLCEVLKNESSK